MTEPATPSPDSATIPREPLPASRKVYVGNDAGTLQVPMREIALTDGTAATLYDTSGPYTDPAAAIDIHRGLPDLPPMLVGSGSTGLPNGISAPKGAPRVTS